MPSNYDKEAADRLAESIAADPHIYLLADAIADLSGLRTEFAREENRACLLVDLLGRGIGSRKGAAEYMTVPGKWQRILQISSDLGATMPWSPPTESRVRQWRRKFLPDRCRANPKVVPETLRTIQTVVLELGARRAIQLGQFPEGIEPDFAASNWQHEVIGDGTWVKEFSRAETIIDPEFGEVTIGSRAAGEPRQQQATSFEDKHGKRFSGVLHTVLLTETQVGWVFLGGDQTFGGESHSALFLVEQLAALLGERLHTLCYDRGFTGWLVNWLMARHGVSMISTAMPETSQKKDPEINAHTLDARKALAGLVPARSPKTNKLVAARVQRVLRAAANAEQIREHREQGLPAGIGHPLGTCYYLTSGDKPEKIISRHYPYKVLEHQRSDGSVCAHHMHVDDGALWEAVQEGQRWVKAQRPTCSEARRVRDPETGAWMRVMDWELECTETGQVLREQTIWKPELLSEKADENRKRTPEEQAIEAMQPLPRCDAEFSHAYGRRNESESWFSWYKSTLRRGDSSASLSLDHQLLDFLFAGMVTNARALRRARLAGLISAGEQDG